MTTPHPAELELKSLKLALWRWSNARTYAEGCQRWRELSNLIGIDIAKDDSETRPAAPVCGNPP